MEVAVHAMLRCLRETELDIMAALRMRVLIPLHTVAVTVAALFVRKGWGSRQSKKNHDNYQDN